MNYYLIGMPGSGKSLVGKKISELLNKEYLDIDSEIEKNSLMFISDMFDNYGEIAFRNQETLTLENIKGDNMIISTGGGIIKRDSNQELMKGKIIFLDVSLDVLKQRLKDDYIRPLLRDKTVEELYFERYEKYRKWADIIIDANNLEDTIRQIREVIECEF